MFCYENSDKKCRTCGSKNISRWHSGQYGRPPYYCSFRCRVIGQRNIFLALTIVTSIVCIVLLVFLFQESWGSTELFISFILFLFILVIAIFNTISGFVAYKNSQKGRSTSSRSSPVYSSQYEQERNITPTEYAYRENKSLFPYQPERKLIEPFQMYKSDYKHICMICKLSIDYLDMVYKCPKCENYFHENHLDEWLTSNYTCPVCGNIMKK